MTLRLIKLPAKLIHQIRNWLRKDYQGIKTILIINQNVVDLGQLDLHAQLDLDHLEGQLKLKGACLLYLRNLLPNLRSPRNHADNPSI